MVMAGPVGAIRERCCSLIVSRRFIWNVVRNVGGWWRIEERTDPNIIEARQTSALYKVIYNTFLPRCFTYCGTMIA